MNLDKIRAAMGPVRAVTKPRPESDATPGVIDQAGRAMATPEADEMRRAVARLTETVEDHAKALRERGQNGTGKQLE